MQRRARLQQHPPVVLKTWWRGALLVILLWVSCADFSPEKKPWPGPPIPCAEAFELDAECMPCAQRYCSEQMDAAYGKGWMTDQSFDGTGRCVGYLSCLCDCKTEPATVESNCLECGHYLYKSCRQTRDQASACLSANCGGNTCRLR
jgi:hypothetical protein